MGPGGSKKRLEALITSSGTPLASLTPLAGLDLMLRFYNEDPTKGTLTGWWGVVTRYGEEEVGFAFNFWFRYQPDDDPITTGISLLFKFGPRAVTGAFPGGKMNWCVDPADTADFRSNIHGSEPFQVWGRSPANGVALPGGMAGRSGSLHLRLRLGPREHRAMVRGCFADSPGGTQRDDPRAEARGRPVAACFAGACGLLCRCLDVLSWYEAERVN
jgi:hypothetical protein